MNTRPVVIVRKQPTQGAQAPENNLPAQLTSLIGREREIGHVRHALQRTDVRLLTLTGPGGVGKTRLALQIAEDLLWDFEDGVFIIELAPLTDPNLVLATIAQTLGVKEAGHRSLADGLKQYLRERRMLLLLDNFEQVVEAAPAISGLLEACPNVKALVTSRATLLVRGEHELQVPPLDLPGDEQLGSVEALSHCAAVALFVKRASACKADFALTPANARHVAEICARLDGLPLAIELAAVHIKILSPQAMLSRLEKRLPLLVGGARDLPARHQTLRAAMEWSYRLLSDAEKMLSRRMAVFVGGATLEAVEAVVFGQSSYTSLEISPLEGIRALVDKSLLRQAELHGEPWLTMLETVREYGLEQLAAGGELDVIRRLHTAYYMEWAEKLEPDLAGPDQGALMDRLERDHDNLRAALNWAIEGKETVIGLRLTVALWWFWRVRGYLSEGRRWLEAVLALPLDGGIASWTPEDKLLRTKALNGAGVLAYEQGDYGPAIRFHEESLALAREIGRKGGISASLNNLGLIARGQGDYLQAAKFYEESLALRREMDDKWSISICLNNLGVIAFELGDHERARTMQEESLALRREFGDKRGAAIALNNLGTVLCRQGDYERARTLQEESLALHTEVAGKWGMAGALAGLGQVALYQGESTQARKHYSQSLAYRQEVGDREGIAECLEGLATVAAMQKQPAQAARLFGMAGALREEIGAPIPPSGRALYEQGVGDVRGALGETLFAAAWAEGRAMKPEQALAIQDISPTPSEVQPPPTAISTPVMMSEAEFAAATQDLLRNFTRAGALQHNPLLQSRLVAHAGATGNIVQRAIALQDLVREACETLQQSPRDAKLYRAVYHTHIHPAPTQEQAAELLDLPFSTYRRHLKEGVARVAEILWQWEVAASGA
ncbi:MAG TPA: tetratricopeptide repeat protein [Chloroflexia bacterium]|nr:tetratricopeptide repeat protein [Chloroflexia bacterium]